MSDKALRREVRRTYTIRLLFPLLFILAALYFWKYYPYNEYYKITKLSSAEEIADYEQEENTYISLTIDTLYYTGCDYTNGKTVKGSYYYALSDDECFFFLLEPYSGKSEDGTRNSRKAEGLVRLETETHKTLVSQMSEQLSWFSDELNDMASVYIVDTVTSNRQMNNLGFGAACLLLLICALSVLANLYVVLRPQSAKVYKALYKHFPESGLSR